MFSSVRAPTHRLERGFIFKRDIMDLTSSKCRSERRVDGRIFHHRYGVLFQEGSQCTDGEVANGGASCILVNEWRAHHTVGFSSPMIQRLSSCSEVFQIGKPDAEKVALA
jgi:hypothetical protein